MPALAQRALVSADDSWVRSNSGRREGALQELKLATESICYIVLWRWLLKREPRPESFKQRVTELARKRYQPSLRDYYWVTKEEFYKGFVESLPSLDPYDKQFLLETLGPEIDSLNKQRSPAEHPKPDYQPQDDALRVTYERFIGIRRAGVLPTLARIRVKLESTQKEFGEAWPRLCQERVTLDDASAPVVGLGNSESRTADPRGACVPDAAVDLGQRHRRRRADSAPADRGRGGDTLGEQRPESQPDALEPVLGGQVERRQGVPRGVQPTGNGGRA